MILNTGLDAACTSSAGNTADSPSFANFIRYACFGTGSSAPDPTDTALDAQVGTRTNNTGGFPSNLEEGLDPANGRMWLEVEFTRVFNITANVNATEWGLAPATTGDLSVRELFRTDPLDNTSSPITLTLEEGDQLQLVISLRVEAPYGYETKSFTITGAPGHDSNGTYEGNASVSSSGSTPSRALTQMWPGNSTGFRSASSDQSSRPVDTWLTGTVSHGNMTLLDYSPGDHYRDATITLSTGDANYDHYAWLAGTLASGLTYGLYFILTNPPYLTKESTHRLTLTVRKHISRL